ncbi:MAG: protein kinase [Gammaproteobacteria bacterium]|nr:protein kinase [Gammaproteobacteria bacterium]MBV9697063.1 protein kinase [Gammaproteobacteria bacterium]
MRVLLIEEDARRCAQIRQRLVSWRPQAELIVHRPVAQGTLAPDFLAQGFDAVLLAEEWPGGRGLSWVRDLSSRAGFAPLVLLCGKDQAAVRDATALGAYALKREELADEAFARVLAAAEQRQSHARALWRSSSAGRATQRFGDAFIRGYRCIRRLASGSSTDLYLAESERAGTLVALKVARDRQDEGEQPVDAFQRFLQEHEIVQRIASDAVVRLYDLGVSDEHAWLVMEYFPRGDLRRRMRRGLTPREALRYALAIARALSAVHAAGVLHRDLKPGNVMLREDGTIALIDFGLSKDAALALDITDTGTIFGTPHYMSPEQGHAEAIDARSDLYSLGVILFEMLTGSKPFRADNPMAIVYKHRKEAVPRLPEKFAALQPLTDRLLAKSPAERFGSAAELATELRGTLERWRARAAQR